VDGKRTKRRDVTAFSNAAPALPRAICSRRHARPASEGAAECARFGKPGEKGDLCGRCAANGQVPHGKFSAYIIENLLVGRSLGSQRALHASGT
jgi:hypothetical protein